MASLVSSKSRQTIKEGERNIPRAAAKQKTTVEKTVAANRHIRELTQMYDFTVFRGCYWHLWLKLHRVGVDVFSGLSSWTSDLFDIVGWNSRQPHDEPEHGFCWGMSVGTSVSQQRHSRWIMCRVFHHARIWARTKLYCTFLSTFWHIMLWTHYFMSVFIALLGVVRPDFFVSINDSQLVSQIL